MPITMQGSWTVTVKSKSAARQQRFVVQGATGGNGAHDGTAGVTANVTGPQWSVSVESRANNAAPWLASNMRIEWPVQAAGQIKFDMRSNDVGSDQDYDDLVLTCSIPATATDYVVYGKVRSYKGSCIFNPCFDPWWYVIDNRLSFERAVKFKEIRSVIEKLYPERLKEPPRPIPGPDPAPFTPIMIPSGQAAGGSREISVTRQVDVKGEMQPRMASAINAEQTAVFLASRQPVGSARFAEFRQDVIEIAKIKDGLKLACTVKERAGLLLRFLEYDRTAGELAGGPYTGLGARQLLGHAVTDERGNYIFRFSQSLEDLAAETEDIVAGGAPLAVQLRPDLLAQIVTGVTEGAGVLYTTALLADVPNLKRIDLCVPDSLVPDSPACQGGRAIQAIGNVWTIPGTANSFDAAGRITAFDPPIVSGAWVGRLDMFACFLELPSVKWYTVRFRKPGGSWSFVQEMLLHPKISDLFLPNYMGTQVGPFPTMLGVDGGALAQTPAYKNIESDEGWIATHRLRKARLSSAIYESALYGPGDDPRTVQFRIEGYDEFGTKVAAADDTISLYIDNRPMEGNIESLTMSGDVASECALFELPTEDEPITVKYRIHQPGGFLSSYWLGVTRGSATGVAVNDTEVPAEPLSVTYSFPAHGTTLFGTLDGAAPDASGYVTVTLESASGRWLPAGQAFCAFRFSIGATKRSTDGYGVTGGGELDFELIGISGAP